VSAPSPFDVAVRDACSEAARAAVAEALAKQVLPVPRRWLTMQEAAEYCGLDYYNLNKMCRQERGPKAVVKRKKMIRFDILELDRWMLSEEGRDG